ncbi:MAG: hypothetical protein IT214_11485 [Chitinophagaceae bacterium]|nr:hypothetical protein [Chitinophagaceae bacterium]
MKKISLVLFLATGLCVYAQNNENGLQSDSLEVQNVPLPDSTPIGTPLGNKVSKEIGPEGGRLISEDGKVELIIPASALNETTLISIQSVTNVIPNGNKSYQFEPSGIQFKKPAQIIFHYSDEEAEACPPELKFMALQDDKGKWEYFNYEDWDNTTKSLKASILHFSTFVDGNEVQLNAEEKRIKAGKTEFFSVTKVTPPPLPVAEGEDELPYLPVIVRRDKREALWKVNEIVGGSKKYGTIRAISKQELKAKYTAPESLTTDLITVKLDLNDVFFEKKITKLWKKGKYISDKRKTVNVASLSCRVKLYDEYKITIIFYINSASEVKDTASFVAEIDNDSYSISNILNYPPACTKPPNPYKAKAELIVDGSCIGPLNFKESDILSYTVSNNYPPQIFFTVKESENLVYKFRFTSKLTPNPPFQNMIISSEPHEIKFLANGKRQVIDYRIFKNIVMPIR